MSPPRVWPSRQTADVQRHSFWEVAEAIRWLLQVDRNQRLPSCVELFDMLYEDTAVGRLGPPSQPASLLHIEPPLVAKEQFGATPVSPTGVAPPAVVRASEPPTDERRAFAAAPTGA